jgi:single-strand DNA-binding protein
VNVIVISGLVETMETRATRDGNFLAKFTVGTLDRFYTKAGEPKASRTAFDCVAWGKLAQHVEHIETGSYIEVHGKMQLRCYEGRDKQKKWKWELAAARVDLIWKEGSMVASQKHDPSPPQPEAGSGGADEGDAREET